MTIKMILAVDQGGSIGWSSGFLPWKLSADLKRFKALTTNSMVVMGRTTYISLGMPNGLPNRRNVVLSRRPYREIRGQITGDVEIISSLDWVRQHNEAAHRTVAETDREPASIWIIGGASVYEEALKLDLVDEIYLTLVHATSGADVRMTTDLVAWKRFVLTERARGVDWEVEPLSRQWDGDVETSYVTFKRV